MAAAVGNKGGARSDINVTPLVDVVLVLLIIFMVLSPASTAHVPNAIPQQGETDTSQVVANAQLVLEIRQDQTVWLNSKQVSRHELASKLRDAMKGRTSRTVFVAAEDEVAYGDVVTWMAVARESGAETVALQLAPVAGGGSAAGASGAAGDAASG